MKNDPPLKLLRSSEKDEEKEANKFWGRTRCQTCWSWMKWTTEHVWNKSPQEERGVCLSEATPMWGRGDCTQAAGRALSV